MPKPLFRFFLSFCLITTYLLSSQAIAAKIETGNDQLNIIFSALLSGSFQQKGEALKKLATSDIKNKAQFLDGILKGTLKLHKKSKRLVWVVKKGSKYQMTDAINGNDLGLEKKRKIKKFSINNKIREQISKILSVMDLDSLDAETRLSAVKSMIQSPSADNVILLEQRVDQEKDVSVKEQMQLVIAVSKLFHNDEKVRLLAIEEVKESLETSVRNALIQIQTNDSSPVVRKAANKVVKIQQEKVSFYGKIETFFFGLSLGSVLVLAAIGLAITFGVMGVINMAHGELIMLGAYTTYLIQQVMPESIGLALVLSIPAAFIVSGGVGVIIERRVIRHLYGRPLETLLATFGISLILQQLVRTVISPQNVPVSNPEWMSGLYEFNSVLSITYNRIYIIFFCLIVFAALYTVLKHTRLGLEVRAVSQNRTMANAMGIRSSKVDALTFGLGSGVAGIAGVALSQLTNVGPNLGQAYIVDSFMVVVFGGVGNLWGTLIGGMSLGVANKFMEPWAGAVLAKILILVFIILFIQKRPRGLFPQKGRAADN